MSCILLVEDNPMNRVLARDILRRRGHQVIEATTVQEGRECLAALIPDVALVDIQIPGGGGETLLREIRATPALGHIRVVAVTAYAMRGDRERFLDAGFDGYLSKPIDTRLFGAEVESYLTNERATPP